MTLKQIIKKYFFQMWTKFWYEKNQSLSWLPTLWKSRDPLVRASALQLLASLINGPHTALQLLNAIDLSPGELCLSLLYFITTQEESCIVKEEACLAMSNLIKNSNSIVFQYVSYILPGKSNDVGLSQYKAWPQEDEQW